ncbi:uncharacterized protein LOC143491550 [Brachyhypopomus gauderio]|uniref:uncharacterized protein LOC143491550 n=1 Tax=Brachyhypopomus gauderio TaxID=698409 RepID=UPI004042B936
MHLMMSTTAPQADLVETFSDDLIQGVKETRKLSKALLTQGQLSGEEYDNITAAPNSQDRMKLLLQALSNRGKQGRDALYCLLQEHEPELTLQMEHALYVHTVKEKLIEKVQHVEPVAHWMFNHGVIEEDEYFEVCEEEGSKKRMQAMFQILEQHGAKESDGFFAALFHCEPLLHRDLEKERVLQMYGLDKENNQITELMSLRNLEERWKELEIRERKLEKEKEELRRERNILETSKMEMDRERKQLTEMKSKLKREQLW